MELTRIWEVIRRRRWIILQALIIITLIAFGGSYLVTPAYQASSKIMIKQPKKSGIDMGRLFQSKNINIGLSGLSTIITTSPDVDVNKVLATSRPMINMMASNLQLRDTGGNPITADKLTQTGMVYRMKTRIIPQPNIAITQYQDTDILEIVATSPDPEEAMMMANTLSEIMVDENQIQMRAEYKSARIFLEDQIQGVKARYDKALLILTDFRKKEKTIDLAMETKLGTEKIAELLKQKEDTVIDLAQARAKESRLKEQLALQGFEFVAASTLQENPQIEILKKRLTDLKIQLSEATAELTDRHPKVTTLREQIRMAEAELKKEIETYKSSAPELVALERQIASLEAHLRGVNADLEKYFQTLGGLPDKAYKQANLDMELSVSQRSYSTLLDYLSQVGIAEATTLSEIRMVDPAVRPVSPISPNKLLNGLLGLFLGLVFGVGLAFIADYVDDTIRTPEDVKEFKPVALLGAVPHFKQEKIPLISAIDPNDPLYESYRRIRNNLKFIDDKPLKSLLITCAGPGEGKSTTVVNLGISAAREGKRVLIIDTDLRRPSLHTHLNLSNAGGVTDILHGKTSADDAIKPTQIQGLSIITSGPPPPDPGVLIESDQMERLISHVRNQFEFVIMDSAPLLVKSDALILARYVEGTMIVLESGKTTRHAIYELMEILANANIKPLGFILNRFSVEKGKYYYHHYYYGGKYLPEKTIE
jgi:capsular exopolysaccharide synthesis family protein